MTIKKKLIFILMMLFVGQISYGAAAADGSFDYTDQEAQDDKIQPIKLPMLKLQIGLIDRIKCTERYMAVVHAQKQGCMVFDAQTGKQMSIPLLTQRYTSLTVHFHKNSLVLKESFKGNYYRLHVIDLVSQDCVWTMDIQADMVTCCQQHIAVVKERNGEVTCTLLDIVNHTEVEKHQLQGIHYFVNWQDSLLCIKHNDQSLCGYFIDYKTGKISSTTYVQGIDHITHYIVHGNFVMIAHTQDEDLNSGSKKYHLLNGQQGKSVELKQLEQKHVLDFKVCCDSIVVRYRDNDSCDGKVIIFDGKTGDEIALDCVPQLYDIQDVTCVGDRIIIKYSHQDQIKYVMIKSNGLEVQETVFKDCNKITVQETVSNRLVKNVLCIIPSGDNRHMYNTLQVAVQAYDQDDYRTVDKCCKDIEKVDISDFPVPLQFTINYCVHTFKRYLSTQKRANFAMLSMFAKNLGCVDSVKGILAMDEVAVQRHMIPCLTELTGEQKHYKDANANATNGLVTFDTTYLVYTIAGDRFTVTLHDKQTGTKLSCPELEELREVRFANQVEQSFLVGYGADDHNVQLALFDAKKGEAIVAPSLQNLQGYFCNKKYKNNVLVGLKDHRGIKKVMLIDTHTGQQISSCLDHLIYVEEVMQVADKFVVTYSTPDKKCCMVCDAQTGEEVKFVMLQEKNIIITVALENYILFICSEDKARQVFALNMTTGEIVDFTSHNFIKVIVTESVGLLFLQRSDYLCVFDMKTGHATYHTVIFDNALCSDRGAMFSREQGSEFVYVDFETRKEQRCSLLDRDVCIEQFYDVGHERVLVEYKEVGSDDKKACLYESVLKL